MIFSSIIVFLFQLGAFSQLEEASNLFVWIVRCQHRMALLLPRRIFSAHPTLFIQGIIMILILTLSDNVDCPLNNHNPLLSSFIIIIFCACCNTFTELGFPSQSQGMNHGWSKPWMLWQVVWLVHSYSFLPYRGTALMREEKHPYLIEFGLAIWLL